MKVSLANLMKTQVEKMSDSIPEQKLMKTSELNKHEQKIIITEALIRCQARDWRHAARVGAGRRRCGSLEFRGAKHESYGGTLTGFRGVEKHGLTVWVGVLSRLPFP